MTYRYHFEGGKEGPCDTEKSVPVLGKREKRKNREREENRSPIE